MVSSGLTKLFKIFGGQRITCPNANSGLTMIGINEVWLYQSGGGISLPQPVASALRRLDWASDQVNKDGHVHALVLIEGSDTQVLAGQALFEVVELDEPGQAENIGKVDAVDVGLGRDERGLGLAHNLKFGIAEFGDLWVSLENLTWPESAVKKSLASSLLMR